MGMFTSKTSELDLGEQLASRSHTRGVPKGARGTSGTLRPVALGRDGQALGLEEVSRPHRGLRGFPQRLSLQAAGATASELREDHWKGPGRPEAQHRGSGSGPSAIRLNEGGLGQAHTPARPLPRKAGRPLLPTSDTSPCSQQLLVSIRCGWMWSPNGSELRDGWHSVATRDTATDGR